MRITTFIINILITIFMGLITLSLVIPEKMEETYLYVFEVQIGVGSTYQFEYINVNEKTHDNLGSYGYFPLIDENGESDYSNAYGITYGEIG